jgi:flavin-dependent dehydrogenase
MAYGYAIGYPDGKYATVGVTLRPDYVNRPIEEYFTALNKYIWDLTSDAKIVETFRGFVTAGKGSQTLVKGNTVFIGEAGGFQDPVMGFGMAPALLSASVAAQIVCKALASKNLNILQQFEVEARQNLIRNEAALNWGFRDFLLESLTEANMEALVRVMGKHPRTFERILKTGRYKSSILPLVFESLVRHPSLLLAPFRFTKRKLFGKPKISPLIIEPGDNAGRIAPP